MSLSWATAGGNGKAQCDIASIDLLVPRDADRPLQTALAERMPERRAQAIAGISQHASEMHAGRSHPVDFVDGDLGFTAERLAVHRNPCRFHANRIARPALRQEQLQAHHHRHLAARQRHRDQRLAVGGLPQGRGILRGNADRMAALLRQRRVVDHQHRVGATDQPVRLHEQLGLQRCGIPQASSNEMVQLVIVTGTSRSAIGCTLLRSPGPMRPAI